LNTVTQPAARRADMSGNANVPSGAARSSHAKAIVVAWLAAGTLDILAAFATSAFKGVGPLSVLKAVASGLLGAKAFKGGPDAAALGLTLHFAIMLGIVLVYWAASRKMRFLAARPVPAGLLYGIAVYAVMSLVVLPLSAIAFKPDYSWSSLATGITVHMLCVGLPIALLLGKFGGRR
jgi:hypothetical protein